MRAIKGILALRGENWIIIACNISFGFTFIGQFFLEAKMNQKIYGEYNGAL